MVFRSSRTWCYICRDEKPDVTCSEKHCKKSFHWDCLRNTGEFKEEDANGEPYKCSRCREDQDTDSSSSEGCFERPQKEASVFSEENEESADPLKTSRTEVVGKGVKSTLINLGGGKPKLGNVDICYVCQKGGKLLCCDLCDQSYHPKCIDSEFLDPILFDASGKWGCPICHGKDPLKNMSHKRMTKRERQEKSDLWQKCIARESRRCRVNRSKFLYSCWNALEPFVSSDILAKIKKEALRSLASSGPLSSSAPVVAPKECFITKKRRSDSQSFTNDATLLTSTQVTSPTHETCYTAEHPPSDSGGTSASSALLTNSTTLENVSPSKESFVLYRDETLWKDVLSRASYSEYELLGPGVQLKPYQIWGVNWLLHAFYCKAGAILADEMGLGKTIQTLAFLSALKASDISGPHLIVVPLSTVGNWIREVRAFTPSLTVTKICGSRQEREHSMMDGVASAGIYDLFVTTYETVVTEEWFFTDRFQWQCVILDEAHRIKNDNARMRHSLDRVKCNMRVLLTGTPLQNNVRELFTLLNFLFPEVIKSSKVVETIFSVSRKKKKANNNPPGSALMVEDDLIDPTVLDKEKVGALTFLLSKLMLRRTKDLVVKLPSKIEYDIWLPLSAQAGLWYKRLLELTTNTTDDTTSLRKLLGAVVKIRICCCHPRGLVSRDAQLQNLVKTFRDSGWSEENVQAVQQDAEELKKETFGLNHIRCSSKLIFLDKLLRQLHSENMDLCPDYKSEFLKSCENRLHQEINSRTVLLTNANNGRVIPNVCPKRLKQELDILNTPQERGGGLLGLHRFMYGEDLLSSTQDHWMAKYTYPSAPDAPSDKLGDPRPHKVLVFTQFQLVLDELSAYCTWRGWRYMRLDGSTNKMIRELDTREFNSPDSTHFVYLISTRAGGLGINLVTANHVVMYDEDWNPFVDLQAVDRAHRIGQLRHVHVWRLITEWTIEERMALRRQQKLRLDKMLIQANVEALECNEETSFQEKLSSEEVRRLLQYGRTALLEAHFTNEIENCTLEEIVQRKRRDLKELEEEKLRLFHEDESVDGENMVDSSNFTQEWNAEAQNDQDEDSEALSPHHVTMESLLESPEDYEKEESLIDHHETSSEYTVYHRPQRMRRQPVVAYNPVIRLAKVHIERRILRERRCFRCGGAGPSHGTKACEKSQDDPLVGCMRCPKVYHLSGCLGLSEAPPRSWMCPWHECCLCFRRAGNCGGLLIHCIECPTAFCFDCFPPEYRRYEPPPLFFENLQRRGWNVTPKKLVTFLCSKCKALKEQERRRHLSKEQLEDEMKSRKVKDNSARQDAKKQQQTRDQRALAKEERQKQADAKKQFSEQKKKLDDYDKQLQQDLRKAVDLLYPPEYLSIIDSKRKRLVESHQQVSSSSQEQPKRPSEEHLEKKDTSEGNKSDTPCSETLPLECEKEKQQSGRRRDHSMNLRPPAPHVTDASHRKRLVIPDRLKRPGETLKLCENCHFPLHDLIQCPFPIEFCRFRVGAVANTTDTTTDSDKADPGLREVHKETESCKSSPSKIKFRTVCSLCKSVVKLHGRRHCSELDPSEKEKYIERRGKYEKLVSLLQQLHHQNTTSYLVLPSRLQALVNTENFNEQAVTDKLLDSVRRELNTRLFTLLSDLLNEIQLACCVATQTPIVEHLPPNETEKTESKPSRKKMSKGKGAETPKPSVSSSCETSVLNVESSNPHPMGSLPEPSRPPISGAEASPTLLHAPKTTKSTEAPTSTITNNTTNSHGHRATGQNIATLPTTKKRKVEESPMSPQQKSPLENSSLKKKDSTETSLSSLSGPSDSQPILSKTTHKTPHTSKLIKATKSSKSHSIHPREPANHLRQTCSQRTLPHLYNAFNPRNTSTNMRTLSHAMNDSFTSSVVNAAYHTHSATTNDMMVTAALLLNAQQSSDLSNSLRMPPPGAMSHPCLPHPSAFWTPLPQPTRSVVSCLNTPFSPSINTVDLLSRKPNFMFSSTSTVQPPPDVPMDVTNDNVVEIELDSELT